MGYQGEIIKKVRQYKRKKWLKKMIDEVGCPPANEPENGQIGLKNQESPWDKPVETLSEKRF